MLLLVPGLASAQTLSWKNTHGPGDGNQVHGLAYDGSRNVLYAGTGGGTVYRNANPTGGGAWMTTGGPGASFIYCLAYNSTGNILFAGAANGLVYRNSNPSGAGAWTSTVGPGDQVDCMYYDSSANVLYAGTQSGVVYRNTNPAGAGTWTSTGGPGAVVGCLAYDTQKKILYAGTAGTGGNVYRNVNPAGAGTWVNTGGPGAGWIWGLAIDESSNMLYAGSTDGFVYVKSNASGTGAWAQTTGPDNGAVCSLVFDSVSDTLYAATTGGFAYMEQASGMGLVANTWHNTGGPNDGWGIPMVNDSSNAILYCGTFNGNAWWAKTHWVVKASVQGGGGTVSPTIQQVPLTGGPASIAITPDPGYAIQSITDNGKPEPVSNRYVISNVKTDHNVVVKFTPGATWYLAEGTNAWGFSTYITIENPNAAAVTAKITYMDPNVEPKGKGRVFPPRTITLPALSQTTVSSASVIGNVDFSTKVECLEGKMIAVDRTMFWTGPGYSPAQSGYHSSIGATSPSKTWYLPEGSSNWGFETWTLIENPNPTAAQVKLTYMTETQGAKTLSKTVPAYSRATYNMQADIGAADSSIQVSSDIPGVAERSMYKNNRREGSCSIGATTPSNDYFLAEGATGYNVGFTTYVLVQNPQSTPTDVTLTYQSCQVAGPSFTMQPNSRKTVRVNDNLPANTNVSTRVHGSQPIIAERAMYWDNGTGTAFHASIGLPSPHMTFYMPDGQTSNGFETWTLVQNPNPGAVTVRLTYLPQNGGTPISFTDEIPPNSRASYSMGAKIPSGRASILVQSLDGARPVMVERAMYMNSRGAGTDTIGGFSD